MSLSVGALAVRRVAPAAAAASSLPNSHDQRKKSWKKAIVLGNFYFGTYYCPPDPTAFAINLPKPLDLQHI